MNAPEQHVIAFGNPADGFEYVGPFGSFEEAETYGYNNGRFRDWWVILLQAPATDVAQP